VVETISREELKEKMDRGDDFVLIDTLAENHRPDDERMVVFVRPEHTTQKSG
jgi:hypothetical protein